MQALEVEVGRVAEELVLLGNRDTLELHNIVGIDRMRPFVDKIGQDLPHRQD